MTHENSREEIEKQYFAASNNLVELELVLSAGKTNSDNMLSNLVIKGSGIYQ